MHEKTLRQRLWVFFDESNEWSAWTYHISIYALIAASILELLSEYDIIHTNLTLYQHHVIDFAITSIFAVDYVTRLWAAPARLRFTGNFYNVIDLAAILPSFVVLLTGFGSTTTNALRGLRILRALRVLRLVRAARIAEKELVDEYYLKSRADEEFAFYTELFAFYTKLGVGTSDAKDREQMLSRVKAAGSSTRDSLRKMRDINEKRIFLLGFLEFVEQLEATLSRPDNEFNKRKVETLTGELGALIRAEHTVEAVPLPRSHSIPAAIQMLRLFKVSFKAVIVTFAIGFSINIVFKITGIYEYFTPIVDNLYIVEAAAGGLIVFITSFNLSYTNAKRGEIDTLLVEVSNLLAIYARNIQATIASKEPDPKRRKTLYEEIDHHFDVIGFNIINGVRTGNRYNLKFDTVILQSIDRIWAQIAPYMLQLDDVGRSYIETIHDNLIGQLNNFQIKATIRVPYIFDYLNGIVIRITYLILVAVAPFSAIPRILVINLLQRAFYVTASETDNAIFSTSLATLPVQDRVMRRLCRISKVLSE